jgi:hypothetical protein
MLGVTSESIMAATASTTYAAGGECRWQAAGGRRGCGVRRSSGYLSTLQRTRGAGLGSQWGGARRPFSAMRGEARSAGRAGRADRAGRGAYLYSQHGAALTCLALYGENEAPTPQEVKQAQCSGVSAWRRSELGSAVAITSSTSHRRRPSSSTIAATHRPHLYTSRPRLPASPPLLTPSSSSSPPPHICHSRHGESHGLYTRHS